MTGLLVIAGTGLPHDAGSLALLWLFLLSVVLVGVWLAGKLP